LALVLASVLARVAAAEEPELRIQVGDRIRYRLGDEKTARAVVLETSLEWLRVQDANGAERRLDRSGLHSLAAARGHKRHAWQGAAIGLVSMALMGGLAVAGNCEADSECAASAGALVFGVFGSVVGAGVGALIKSDRWQEAPVSRIRFGLAPMPGGGVRARLSLSF
jgi:hypothetical protein